MKPIQSVFENRVDDFDRMKDYLYDYQFTLGGNWDYHHGCFDHALDEANKVWLRLPFEVTQGTLEGAETPNPGTRIVMGTPFVLKHVYNEGLDPEAEARTFGAMFDQFQTPLDSDASLEDHWIQKGTELLREVERGIS
ncbi:MAG: YugN-like family protein [Paenibacillus sp.]|nr:YugN-like family protein [Paenibacillus sp.]